MVHILLGQRFDFVDTVGSLSLTNYNTGKWRVKKRREIHFCLHTSHCLETLLKSEKQSGRKINCKNNHAINTDFFYNKILTDNTWHDSIEKWESKRAKKRKKKKKSQLGLATSILDFCKFSCLNSAQSGYPTYIFL